jgi:signal transduction histidine kinase
LNGFYSVGRDALLLETLSVVAKCQNPQSFWTETLGRLKWIIDFTRVDVALRNPGEETYSLQTVFELRPVPLASEVALPLSRGIVGEMLRSGEACHLFQPGIEPFGRDCVVDEGLEGGTLLSILSVTLESCGNVLGVLSFGSTDEHGYGHEDIEIASRFATHATIAIQNWQHLTKLKEDTILLDLAAEELRDSQATLESLVVERTTALHRVSQRLLKIQDEERRRIARDLHDSTSQILAGVMMNVGTLQRRFDKGDPTSDALSEIAGLADRALQEIRTTSYLLHPPMLDEIGLASAICWYVEGFAKRSGIHVDLDFPASSERLPPDLEMGLFRILQEGLTNVHRHSGASTVRVVLEHRLDALAFEVKDNGHGIAPELLERLQRGGGDTGVGLAGMRERVSELNGRLEMESNPDGTTLRVRIPLVCADQLINQVAQPPLC